MMKRFSDLIRFPYCHAWAITVVRIVTGMVFLVHGYQKAFVDGLSAFSGFLSQAGIPAPEFFAPLVAGVELLGGLALVLGLFTRWAAIPLAINMLVAAVAVHLKNGFFLPNGYEYAMVLMASSVSLILAGSGEFALENVVFRNTGTTAPSKPVMA
jgi:putative oxidoreductase